MARRFAKVLEEEIEEAFFYASDLVNTKTTIPLRVGEERWIYTSTLRVSIYIHHYSTTRVNHRVQFTNATTDSVESLNCWFSYDVTKIQTLELLILLRLYFHNV